jgi:tetratricopeptide (TPR) repeat protein
MGVFELARGDGEMAERAFAHALELDPKSVSACLSLSELYRTSGRLALAEKMLQKALASDPRHVIANQAMASFYVATDRAAQAEPYLKMAFEQTQSVEAALSLADFYLAIARRADAVDVLHSILKMKDGFAAATTRLAAIEFIAGRKSNAYKLLQDVLKLNPKHVPALAVRTRLLMSEGRVDEAFQTISAAAVADPKEPSVQILLGKVHLARHESEDARAAFNEAVRLSAHSVEPQIELAKLHLDRGEVQTAIGFVEQALEVDPRNLEAQLILSQGLIAQAEFGKAAEVLKALLGKFPHSPRVLNMVGNLALAKRDGAGARRAWEQTLAIEPDNIDALGGIAALLTVARKPGEGRRLVEARLAKNAQNPSLLLLAAKVRLASGDPKASEAALKQLVQIDPQNLQGYAMLGQMFVSQKRIGDARREYTAVIAQRPQSVPAHTMLGLLCEAEHDIPGAIQWYQKALQIDLKAAVASNNLAWIYVTQDRNLDVALQLAEAATATMQSQPEFFDTLGWIYYKKQLSSFAIRALKRAVELDPSNPVHQYHLGMAYAQEGSDKTARKTLQLALRLNPNFDGAERARKAMAELVY